MLKCLAHSFEKFLIPAHANTHIVVLRLLALKPAEQVFGSPEHHVSEPVAGKPHVTKGNIPGSLGRSMVYLDRRLTTFKN